MLAIYTATAGTSLPSHQKICEFAGNSSERGLITPWAPVCLRAHEGNFY